MSKVAILLGPDFEDYEYRGPLDALRKAGHQIEILGHEAGVIVHGKKGLEKAAIDAAAADRKPASYDALVIPGGYSPDHLRTDRGVVELVRGFAKLGRPIAAICHGPSLLIDADVVHGKRVASWPSIRRDLENAGAEWVDDQVVIDDDLITSRRPEDVPAFAQAVLDRLARPEPVTGPEPYYSSY